MEVTVTVTGSQVAFLDDAAKESLGAGERVPAVVSVGGTEFPVTIVRTYGRWGFPVNGALRRAGLTTGADHVVEIEPRPEADVVEVPDDLAAAIEKSAPARATWGRLSPHNKREYAEWIASASGDVRERRIAQSIVRLRDGRKGR